MGVAVNAVVGVRVGVRVAIGDGDGENVPVDVGAGDAAPSKTRRTRELSACAIYRCPLAATATPLGG